jgi:hypothetical protein
LSADLIHPGDDGMMEIGRAVATHLTRLIPSRSGGFRHNDRSRRASSAKCLRRMDRKKTSGNVFNLLKENVLHESN